MSEILIIQRPDSALSSLPGQLREDAHQVHVAPDLEQALLLLRRRAWQVVIVDLGKGIEDGASVLWRTRREAPAAAIVAVAARWTLELAAAIHLAGVTGCMMGPTEGLALRRAVDQAARQAEAKPLLQEEPGEQRMLHLAIKNAASELRQTIDAVAFPIVMLDDSLRIIRLNLAGKKLLERQSFNEILGQEIGVLSGQQPWSKIADMAQRALAQSRPERAQIWDAGGKATWDLSVYAVKPADERRVIAVAIDMTRLIQQVDRLPGETMGQQLSSLLHGLAYEARQPLFGISASLEAHAGELAGSTALLTMAQDIHEEIQHMASLMEEVVDYAMSSNMVLAPGRLADLAPQSWTSDAAHRRGVKVQVTDERGMRTPLRLDAKRLGQALHILLERAVETSPDGGEVAITFSEVESEGRRWCLCAFHDQGAPLTEADLTEAFEPFHPLPRRGKGLGLSIAASVIASHGGRVALMNRRGGGVTTRVALPIQED